MFRLLVSITCLFIFHIASFSQILSPANFLGFQSETRFSRHDQILDYIQSVSEHSSNVRTHTYGHTYEGRELQLVFVSSASNLQKLDSIRLNNLRSSGFLDGDVNGKRLPIVWLSFNIHGNEASPSEAAMELVYHLAARDTANWLDSLIVIIDPCVNPDGRERFVNWNNAVSDLTPNPDPYSIENHEPWPYGRTNHYFFDLNRDWCWQTQAESRARAAMYHRWMPHVHVDFHEQWHNDPYFFGAAADPIHEVVTPWQKEFQVISGNTIGKYFDQNGWLYFSKESFDLFYPSYGDTWPMYQGAIGFTYEQAGQAGRAILQENGDTLTLRKRRDHHFTAAWGTIEAAFSQRKKLLTSFDRYFKEREGLKNQTYIIRNGQSHNRIRRFLDLMDGNVIQYGNPKGSFIGRPVTGYSYQEDRRMSLILDRGDILISTDQPQGRLVQVLMEKDASLSDSLTYDLTAWSLPYAYDLEVYAVSQSIPCEEGAILPEPSNSYEEEPYAWLVRWDDFSSSKFLASLLKKGIRVRFGTLPFSVDIQNKKIDFEPGTLLITRADQGKRTSLKEIQEIANQNRIELFPAKNGFTSSGPDFGSSAFEFIKAPKIAMLFDESGSVYTTGDCWFFFEQQLGYPLTRIGKRQVRSESLQNFDVLILPNGNYMGYRQIFSEFLENGGKIIAIENAVNAFTRLNSNSPFQTNLSEQLASEGQTGNASRRPNLTAYGDRARRNQTYRTDGSIYRVKLDPTHPLAFGLGESMFFLKRNREVYPLLSRGFNVGYIQSGQPLSGFAGKAFQKNAAESLVVGQERIMGGKVIYFAESPIFRGFWDSGKLLLANAVFLDF